jgi:hypothetical protein
MSHPHHKLKQDDRHEMAKTCRFDHLHLPVHGQTDGYQA